MDKFLFRKELENIFELLTNKNDLDTNLRKIKFGTRIVNFNNCKFKFERFKDWRIFFGDELNESRIETHGFLQRRYVISHVHELHESRHVSFPYARPRYASDSMLVFLAGL